MIKHISFFKILLVVALLLVVNTGMAQIVATQKLAILSDIHVTPGNANEGKLKEAVAEINGTDVDAVIVSGDLTNEGSDVQLRNVKSILDGITKPLYVIPGFTISLSVLSSHVRSSCLMCPSPIFMNGPQFIPITTSLPTVNTKRSLPHKSLNVLQALWLQLFSWLPGIT